jgi:N6-adenosine-specific RNA methylase IME4
MQGTNKRIAHVNHTGSTPAEDFLREVRHQSYGAILAYPPWQFSNRTGKMAPEHRRLSRYATLTLPAIKQIPVAAVAAEQSHLYLWVPNALLREGLEVLDAWGFQYKTNIIWHKIRKDGGPDGRGVGFYFRNTTEMVLFGVRGKLRTLTPGRTQVNVIATRKREHSRKPDQLYDLIEACSPGPFLELFARGRRRGWEQWGHEAKVDHGPYTQSSPGAPGEAQADGEGRRAAAAVESGPR